MRCAICRQEVERRWMSQKTCGDPVCNQEQKRQASIARAAREDRKATRQKLRELEPISKEHARTQALFNLWIRLRDQGQGCISCGTHKGKPQAGHFFTVGARPELRYHPDNCHLQCYRCNVELSGNISAYQPRLVAKIGQERFDALSGHHPPSHLSKDDLRAFQATLRAQIRTIERGD